MALAKCSTKRVVYLAAAIFLILAIMSHTSSCCQAGEVDLDDRRHKPEMTCYPYSGAHCVDHDCGQVCVNKGFKDGNGAFCSKHGFAYQCCCPHQAV
uniref:Knottin scorpion toxin-like domain-containing protein n=1 Tax=Setaria italica TaxID=4555 RepID=K3ZKI1_SETIT